jgi:hypothetical protein
MSEMNATSSRETTEARALDVPREVRQAMLTDVLRIDRPQRGSLRLVRSQRHFLHVITLQRP